MCKVLTLPGTEIKSWPGVQVFVNQGDGTFAPDPDWKWSTEAHWHYEVAVFDNGSYWVPASTKPPRFWPSPVQVVGTPKMRKGGVNPNHTEMRPSGVYIWIPAIPPGIKPGHADNDVECHPPKTAPKATTIRTSSKLDQAHQRLDAILAHAGTDPPSNTFQDSDGLISFVNLSTNLVTKNPEYLTGVDVFDKTANFFSSLRIKVYASMVDGKIHPLKGDPAPKTQWDPAVTHYMQNLLQQTGGLTNFSITTESYSDTQVIAEFSTDFLKLLFDAATVPTAIISGVTSFISSVGTSLRASWDDRTRDYSIVVLGQCHEAVQQSGVGDPVYRYFPKLKYYYLSVSSSQTEFTTSCSTTQKITFSFNYEYYVTSVAAAVLDHGSDPNKKFVGFLDKAQAANYKDAENRLDTILNDTTSSAPTSMNTFNVDITTYPLAKTAKTKPLIRA